MGSCMVSASALICIGSGGARVFAFLIDVLWLVRPPPWALRSVVSCGGERRQGGWRRRRNVLSWAICLIVQKRSTALRRECQASQREPAKRVGGIRIEYPMN